MAGLNCHAKSRNQARCRVYGALTVVCTVYACFRFRPQVGILFFACVSSHQRPLPSVHNIVLTRLAAMQQMKLQPGGMNVTMRRQSHVARAAATASVVRTSVPLNAKPLLKPRYVRNV